MYTNFRLMRKLIFIYNLLLIGFISTSNAQLEKPVTWSYSIKKLDNMHANVFIKATIDQGWHIYAQAGRSGGPTATKILFNTNNNYLLIGKTIEPKPMTKFEKVYGFNVNYFEKEVIFQQKIKLNSKQTVVKGKVEFMVCNKNQCLPPDEVSFSIPIK